MDSANDIALYMLLRVRGRIRISPFSREINRIDLQHLVYLTDWKHCLLFGETATGEDWEQKSVDGFDIAGSGRELDERFKADPRFRRKSYFKSLLVSYRPSPRGILFGRRVHLSPGTRRAADHVLKTVSELRDGEFTRLVLDTYPFRRSALSGTFDMAKLADEYTHRGLHIGMG